MSTHSLPEDLVPLVAHALESVTERLDEGKDVPPTWFLINRELRAVLPLVIPFGNYEEKCRAAETVRALAYKMQCDCVIFFCEGWGLTRPNAEQAKRVAETGSVRDEPDAVDILMVNVETYEGAWAAQPRVFEKGTRHELGPIELLDGGTLMGRMSNWLPPKPGTTMQ